MACRNTRFGFVVVCALAAAIPMAPAHAKTMAPAAGLIWRPGAGTNGETAVPSMPAMPAPQPDWQADGSPNNFNPVCTPSRPLIRWTMTAKLDFWRAGFAAGLPAFLLSEVLIGLAFFLSMFGLGLAIRQWHWNANYTRKLLGAVMLATPIAVGTWVPYTANPLQVIASFLVFLVFLLLFAKPVRDRSAFLQTAFAAIDRPEDRPHTLTWFISAYAVSSVLLLTMMWWAVPDQPAFVFVAFAAVAIGDLLAGAVGHRFGRHRYQTAALFTTKTYTRSFEGSACVFATTALAVLISGAALPAGQFIAALAVLPVVLTLAEAKSPHTWDEPVMFASAMLASLAIVKVWQAGVC